jgi:hypothetical protein
MTRPGLDATVGDGGFKGALFLFFERYGLANAMAVALMIFVVFVVDKKLDVIVAATQLNQQLLIERSIEHTTISAAVIAHVDANRISNVQIVYLLRAMCLNAARGQTAIELCAGPRP